jgi:hypothetical protein
MIAIIPKIIERISVAPCSVSDVMMVAEFARIQIPAML